MTIENELVSTFVAHEHLAPDAAEVLVELRAGLTARGGRPRHRLATLVAAAAVVTAATTTAAVVAAHRHDRSHEAPGAGSTGVLLPLLHVRPGWLPATAAFDGSDASTKGELRSYTARLASGDPVNIGVGRRSQTKLMQHIGGTTTVRDVRVQGRLAREYAGPRYFEIDVRLDGGFVAFAYLQAISNVSRVGRVELEGTARRIAKALIFDAVDTVPAVVTFATLPAGTSIRQMETGHGIASYALSLPAAAGGHAEVAAATGGSKVSVTILSSGGAGGTTVPPIHGHGTPVAPIDGMTGRRFQTTDGQSLVFTTPGGRGRELLLSGAPGKTALHELYALAARLRWSSAAR